MYKARLEVLLQLLQLSIWMLMWLLLLLFSCASFLLPTSYYHHYPCRYYRLCRCRHHYPYQDSPHLFVQSLNDSTGVLQLLDLPLNCLVQLVLWSSTPVSNLCCPVKGSLPAVSLLSSPGVSKPFPLPSYNDRPRALWLLLVSSCL